MAQTINESYDCGTYGAGNYGSNDCVAVNSPPTPTASAPSPQNSTTGSLPVTGAQLGWIAVTSVGLIGLGLALSLRQKRVRGGGPS